MKIMKKITLFIFLTFSYTLSATNYYVSPTGTSTSAGTISAPLNFSTAIAKALVAGDSVLLRDGMYSFNSLQQISKSGTSAKFLFIGAYKNEIPILDFRTEPYNSSNQGIKISGNYVYFKGITVQGAGDNGIQVTGSNNKIELCVARWNSDSGFQMKTGSDNLILNCDSYENFDYESGGTASPDFGGNADGFADKQYTNTGTNTYKGCRSWRNSDDGWDHFEKIGNTVHDSCWCYANGLASYDMSQHIRFKTDSATWFYQFKSTNFVMKNYGNGNGFKLGGNYTAHNAIVHHCISVLNLVKGFDQNNNAGTMTVYNCTGYLNKPDYGFSNSSYGTLVIKNCATLGTKSTNSLACKTVTQAYNTWNSGFSCTTADFTSLDYAQMLNPRQSNGSLPEIPLLHLKATSTMIDKGTNVGYTFSGASPDLGAYEYNVTTALNPLQQTNTDIGVYFSNTTRQITVNGFVASVEVFELSGKKVYSARVHADKLTIPASELSKGVCLVRIITPDGVCSTAKIIVD
jgi:hypothetical protein